MPINRNDWESSRPILTLLQRCTLRLATNRSILAMLNSLVALKDTSAWWNTGHRVENYYSIQGLLVWCLRYFSDLLPDSALEKLDSFSCFVCVLVHWFYSEVQGCIKAWMQLPPVPVAGTAALCNRTKVSDIMMYQTGWTMVSMETHISRARRTHMIFVNI